MTLNSTESAFSEREVLLVWSRWLAAQEVDAVAALTRLGASQHSAPTRADISATPHPTPPR